MVCILFPYTFVGQASTWFFSLAAGSIASWQQFESSFLIQFRYDKTYGVLFLELSRIRFDKKDKVKDLNRIFINLLNRIPEKPTNSIQVELCTNALPPPIAMFVKARENKTLVKKFLKTIKVENDLASISSHHGNKENKPSSLEKIIKKNKGITILDSEKKEKDPTYMKRM